MGKFLFILGLASVATAIDTFSDGPHHQPHGHGFARRIGYPGSFGIGGLGVSKHSSVGSSHHIGSAIGGVGYSGLGVSKQVSSSVGVGSGLGPIGIGGIGGIGGGPGSFGSGIGGIGVGSGGFSGGIGSIGGGSGGFGGGIGSFGGGLGYGGIGISKQISSSSHGAALGPIGLGGIGGIGGGVGHGGLGVSRQISSIGSSHSSHHVGGLGLGIGGIRHSSLNQVSNVGHHHHHGIGLAALGGIGSLGHIGSIHSLQGVSNVNRLAIPSIATIPGGYFGGILAFPQSIPTAVSATALHIPGPAIDTYKGYFAGYYPGSAGYGHSYRFFH